MPEPLDLPKLQRDRLRAQADMFAAVSKHGTIIGTAREIALIEFFRALVPKRYEVLTGAIVAESEGSIEKATNQLDVLVVDTLRYPTLLRAGDLAVVFAQSVLVVVEAKSDLAKGEKFIEAMAQIGQAKLLAGAALPLTCLYCFAAPTQSKTLREWIEDVLAERRRLLEAASSEPDPTKKKANRDLASRFTAENLPDLIVSDEGAIAMRRYQGPEYEFFRAGKGSTPIVALASKVLDRVVRDLSTEYSDDAQGKPSGLKTAMKTLTDHFEAGLSKTDDKPLEITDPPPEAEKGE